jgi:hypothetical protein
MVSPICTAMGNSQKMIGNEIYGWTKKIMVSNDTKSLTKKTRVTPA